MFRCMGLLVAAVTLQHVLAKLDTEEDNDTGESGDRDFDLDSSSEHIGAAVTQITRHPYAASLLKNNTYVCSAVILNTFWLITESKCFDSEVISSYVTHRNLKNFTIRVGSSYNNKGGSVHRIMTLINNFDMKISAIKLTTQLEFNSRVRSARLPGYDEEVTLGYLASIIAWTPNAHMRVVNAPVIEASICDTYTKLLPGHYICVGGVLDVNRHFCRKDNGGAVIQNNTLIAISSYIHECALYSRTHAFPKVSSFSRWLDSVIWDEENRPTSASPTSTAKMTISPNVTDDPNVENRSPYFGDPRKFMLTLPFEPINVPLEPAQDNSVIPRMSMYESYLQNIARARTSTTQDPTVVEQEKKGFEMEWMKKFGNMMPNMYPGKRYQEFSEFNG